MTSHATIPSVVDAPVSGPGVTPVPLRPRLPDQITIQYGPPGLLGRFFLKADTAARERGVTLSVAPLEELMEVNRANKATWFSLVSTFDPEVGGATKDTGFCILGRNAQGDVVATQAARYFDWTDTNLKAECESLRLWYADPQRSARPDEVSRIASPSAPMLGGRVLFTGGAWYRPDFRGRLLSMIMPRLGRTLALTKWNIDYALGMMTDKVVAGGMAERCGYKRIEPGLEMWNSPMSPYTKGVLVWMPASELLDDLDRFLVEFEAQVDARVEHRHAEHA
jgi:hypothetical protein